MRTTRKWLRFLRTLSFLRQIYSDFHKSAKCACLSLRLLNLLSVLEGVFKVLFYLFDHHVVLGELQVLPKEHVSIFYPKSMKMYLWQNIVGALKALLEVLLLVQRGSLDEEKAQEDLAKGEKLVRSKSIEFLRNVLDIFVACYYLNRPSGLAGRAGFIGILTSLIALGQALKLI